ncbi:MAG: IS66 family transposase [Anaerovibrio lipolyticus]|nr:IS66 family transposase [Anaerovibrio lipolyticus]
MDISEKDRHCPACCSDELVPVGKEHVRDEVRIIPAKIIVDEIYQKVYKCKACENDEHVEFVKAPTPKQLVPNSPVTPSVITATMLNKFQFALPLQRQEKLWQIMGLNLSKQTMANWIQYAYRDYLKPLIELMKRPYLAASLRKWASYLKLNRIVRSFQLKNGKNSGKKRPSLFFWLYLSTLKKNRAMFHSHPSFPRP